MGLVLVFWGERNCLFLSVCFCFALFGFFGVFLCVYFLVCIFVWFGFVWDFWGLVFFYYFCFEGCMYMCEKRKM